ERMAWSPKWSGEVPDVRREMNYEPAAAAASGTARASSGGDEGHAEAHVAVALVRVAPVARRGAAQRARRAPRAAADGIEAGLRLRPRLVGAAPLGDVAVHVAQPPGVGGEQPDRRGVVARRSLVGAAVGRARVEVGVAGPEHRAEVERLLAA